MQPPPNNHHSPSFWDEKGEFLGLEEQWEFYKVLWLTMESSQDSEVRVKPPAKNAIIRARGEQQHVPSIHHTPFQLLDPNQVKLAGTAATALVKVNPRAMLWCSGEAVTVHSFNSPMKRE